MLRRWVWGDGSGVKADMGDVRDVGKGWWAR